MGRLREMFHRRTPLSSFQMIVFGFLLVILAGALLLMLPFATQSGVITPFSDALFTATSAVCVTGLVLHDTATYWSLFGQVVIISLIQIGGMGVVTVAVSVALVSGKKISLMQRSTMQEAIAAPQVGGIVRLTGFILKTMIAIELIGAMMMAPVFCRDFGTVRGMWYALFHAISAFCNAGFDLMGVRAPFSSITSYVAQPFISLTIGALIVVGGIGFLTWEDIRTNGLRLRRYRMQSKVILLTTATLILLPALYFYFMLTQLAAKELDMALLPGPTTGDAPGPWRQVRVSLPQGELRGGGCSLPILPLEDEKIVQWITWRGAACGGRADEFAILLEKDLCSSSGSAGGKMI